MIQQLMNGFENHHRKMVQKLFKNKEGKIASNKKENYRLVESHWNTVFNQQAVYDEKIIDEIEQRPIEDSLGTIPNKKEIIKVQEKTLEKNKTRIKANLTYDPLNTNQKTDSKKSHPRIRHENNQPNHIIIQLSVEYIKNNLSSKITIEDLTKITGYSERSLQLVFKKELNQSPIGYLEAERLEKAKALIQMHKQSKKISEIARDVGLIHLGRFSINFKRRFGISPSLLAKA